MKKKFHEKIFTEEILNVKKCNKKDFQIIYVQILKCAMTLKISHSQMQVHDWARAHDAKMPEV